ncbi:clarin-1-like [Anabas testudineus]|uniref:clarin-1-like n=1 Tax=Anabas testudineus TaxID=64144 RepID=UPI000E458A4D|nr:clarin-1-like [Anabas testudineus]XP_026228115.1 clarin-1-like [Anabas testudineus]
MDLKNPGTRNPLTLAVILQLSWKQSSNSPLVQTSLSPRPGSEFLRDANVVFPDLLNAIPAGLHVCIISFCGGVILFSSVASGFFFFNAFGRPFETLQGPMGLYLWTFISCMCSCMVMILFASEVKLHHLSERIANFNEVNFVFQTHSEHYDRCFWLFMLVFLLHGLNILLIRLAGIQFPFQETKEAELSGGAADLMY